METGGKETKVVFLIDASLANCHSNHSTKCHLKEIVLTVFRLLYFFARDVPQQSNAHKSTAKRKRKYRSTFKWGYKFFSTVSTLPRIKSESRLLSFCSFKLRHFEEFESRAAQVFENIEQDKDKRRSVTHPSDNLSTALTEILHDFKWIDQDILSSPVTRSTRQEDRENTTKNMLIILSKSPHDRKSLRKFCNKIVIDSEVFIDSIMSPALLKEYQENKNISVSWVSFNSPTCTNFDGTRSEHELGKDATIIKEAVQKLGGCFLLRDSIVGQTQVIKSNETDDTVEILNSFCSESYLIGLKETTLSKSGDSFKASLKLSDSSESFLIELFAVLNNRRCLEARCLEDTVSTSSLHENIAPVTGQSTNLKLLGYIQNSDVADVILKTNFGVSYMVRSKRSELLMRLLTELKSTDCCGILGMSTDDEKGQNIAVLSASTTSVGFITFMPVDRTLRIYKAMAFGSNDGLANNNAELKSDQQDFIGPSRRKWIHEGMNRICNLKKEGTKPEKGFDEQQIFNPHCLNSWHVAGSSGQLSNFLTKLNERFDTLNNLTSSEKKTLKDLHQLYVKQKQVPVLVEDVITPTPDASIIKVSSSGGSGSSSQASRHFSRRNSASLSRGRLMVDKARSSSFSLLEDPEKSLNTSQSSGFVRRSSSSFGFTDLDLTTEEDLQSYLLKQYNQVLSAGIAMETTVQTMMTVTSLFMSNMQLSNPQKSAVIFIRKHLLLTSTQLKEKYERTDSEEEKKKINEYKLQIMLLMETESALFDTTSSRQEKICNEMVSLLRGLSFLIELSLFHDFLNNVIAVSYSSTLPKILVEIFDELMQPLPPALAGLASPSAPSSVWGGPLSNKSLLSVSVSSQPGSNISDSGSQQYKRPSRLRQHPSFANFAQRKHILVKKVVKPKSKSDSKKIKEQQKHKPRTSKSRHGDFNKAKRNLFTSEKTKSNGKTHVKSRRQKSSASPASKVLVPGTPAHKQSSRRILMKQEQERRHANINPEVRVVAESPVKDDEENPVPLNKPSRYLVREAFYSSSSQPSRNFAKSMEQAEKGHERSFTKGFRKESQGSLASAVRGDSPILSPKSRFIKNFLSSPSPKHGHQSAHKMSAKSLRRSPRKSAKKLLFKKEIETKHAPSNMDAHLIFAGENALDYHIHQSPKKGIPSGAFSDGFKTPEKQKLPSVPDVWEANSCPPLSCTPHSKSAGSELSFKNMFAFNSESRPFMFDGKKSSAQQEITQTSTKATDHSFVKKKRERTPTKSDQRPLILSSPDYATKLRSALSSRSPRKKYESFQELSLKSERIHDLKKPEKAPLTGIGKPFSSPQKTSRHSEERNVIPLNRKKKSSDIAELKDGSPCKKNRNEPRMSTPTKVDRRECELSTPSKAWRGENTLSTPSKVKFLESRLISPPTGSGHPPSAEKSTPKKSILKNSPRVKLAERIDLIQLRSSTFQENEPEIINTPSTGKTGSSTHTMCLEEREERVKKDNDIHRKSFNNDSETEQKRNIQRQESSSSEDDTDCVSQKSDTYTTVTIRTPSPSSKSHTSDVNKWARRKRHSSKASSSSSSNSIHSPSPRDEGKKSQEHVGNGKVDILTLGPFTEELHSKNTVKDNLDLQSSEAYSLGSKKRKLSLIQDNEMAQSPSKKMKKMSRSDLFGAPSSSLAHTKTDVFGPGHSPDLFPPEVDDDTFPQVFSTSDLCSHELSSSSQSSQGALNSNSSQTPDLSSHHIASKVTKRTSSYCGTSEEGSQGFYFQVASIKEKSAMHLEDKVETLSQLQAQTLENQEKPFLREVRMSPRQQKVTPAFPDSVSISLSPPRQGPSKSSNTSRSNSPYATVASSTPDRKQLSPALSTSGLLHLMKSPLLEAEAHQKEAQKRSTRSKSRRHLDLNE